MASSRPGQQGYGGCSLYSSRQPGPKTRQQDAAGASPASEDGPGELSAARPEASTALYQLHVAIGLDTAVRVGRIDWEEYNSHIDCTAGGSGLWGAACLQRGHGLAHHGSWRAAHSTVCNTRAKPVQQQQQLHHQQGMGPAPAAVLVVAGAPAQAVQLLPVSSVQHALCTGCS